MYENEDSQEPDLIEMTDEEGNTLTMRVLEYFFYNGEEYVILTDSISEEENTSEVPESMDCYVMKVTTSLDDNGDELEEFEPIENPDLENRLIEIASTRLNEEEETEEE